MEGGVAKTEVPLEDAPAAHDSAGLQNAPANRRWARRPVSDKARVQRRSWDFFWSSSSSSEDGGFGTREDCDPGILEEDSDVTTASSASEEGDERDEGHHMVGDDDDDEAMKNLSRVEADRIEVFQARTYDRMIVGTVRRHAVPHCGPPVHLFQFREVHECAPRDCRELFMLCMRSHCFFLSSTHAFRTSCPVVYCNPTGARRGAQEVGRRRGCGCG